MTGVNRWTTLTEHKSIKEKLRTAQSKQKTNQMSVNEQQVVPRKYRGVYRCGNKVSFHT